MNIRATDFGMEDPSFILNSLDDMSSYSFGSSFGEPFHHSFSNPISDLKRPIETYQTSFDKPTKVAKTNSWDSIINNNLSNTQATFPNIVTFSNSNYSTHVKQETVPAHVLTAREEPKKMSNTPRFPCNQDHIIAERKRREKLSQKFIALSALVPGLKKMDKASVLGDAIKHLKQLKEQVKELEEQTKKKTMESVVYVKKHELYGDHDGASSDKNFSGESQDETLPEIEARACDGKVLIRIHCEKKRGIVEKTISEIEKLNLSVLNSSVLTFGTSILDITVIAQMDTGFTMSIIDLVKHLREVVKLFK